MFWLYKYKKGDRNIVSRLGIEREVDLLIAPNESILDNINLNNVKFNYALETMWNCKDIVLTDVYIKGDYNKNSLTKEQQNAVETCARYVIYTLFETMERFENWCKEEK